MFEEQAETRSTDDHVSMKSDASMGKPVNFNEGEPRWLEDRESTSPAPSHVSMKSDASMGKPVNFNEGEPRWLEDRESTSPAPSHVSMKSDASMGKPVNFNEGEPRWLEDRESTSPAPSHVSMKSDASMGKPVNFNEGEPRGLEDRESTSPAPSHVSMKSDASMGKPVNFNEGEPRWWEDRESTSPAPSHVSMKSDASMGKLVNFIEGEPRWLEDRESTSPAPSHVSMKSDASMGKLVNFIEGEPRWLEDRESTSPAPSHVSMKSDASMGKPVNFNEGEPRWLEDRESTSPAPSHVSMKSDASIGKPVNFNEGEPRWLEDRESTSPAPSHVSMKSDASMGKPVNFNEGEPSHVSMRSDASMGKPVNFNEGEPRLLEQHDDPLDFMAELRPTSATSASMERKQYENDQKREKEVKEKIKSDQQKKIISQYGAQLKECETDTEIYVIDDNNKKQQVSYNNLFKKSWFSNRRRTMLMTGVAGVGKTFQMRRFMLKWANGESNKNIDLIVTFDFSELSRREDMQSMKDLLSHSLSDNKQREVCKYDSYKIVFIFDGLEKCKLPLDFENNTDLKDIDESASMDVLLTNLIKGNLLPSARVWIISQPSGVEKIPPAYIQKVTECRETLKRLQRLISTQRERFLRENNKDEDINHPNQKDTEHIMREDRGSEVNDKEKNEGTEVKKSVRRVNEMSEIFKAKRKEKSIRTVLTVGEAGIGKSFHVQKFIKALNKNEVIFPLDVHKIGLMRGKTVSLMGLLNHFFLETKRFVFSNFEQLEVLFILDGLEVYEPPLDFENNKMLTDITEPASVDLLLTNLIKGTLFPSARLWITSRHNLPVPCVDRTTEIRCKPDVASQKKLKIQVKQQFTHVSEGIDKQKSSALLNEIYTDLYIIEGDRGEVNDQHETRQVQDAKFKPVTEETLIKYHDIFKPAFGDSKPIRTVLTIGVAGIGKSFATMKYMLDWAEGTANGDIFYMFPLSFRELNLRKEEEHSLEELLSMFFPGMRTSEISDYDKYRILIVLDGFDEFRLRLDFNESYYCRDVKKPISMDVMLSNLIHGNLLPKAQIWITSRPAASNHIPACDIDRVTEVRGFNDEQKEEYFRRRFKDMDLAEKILSHVKKSRSLFIMCHIPVFCWITSKVLEDLVNRNQEEMPKTLTDMYIHFLLLQCRQANVKYTEGATGESSDTDSCWNTRNQETTISLGKLAFDGLEKGNLLFTEEHLKECGVDITGAAVFSGLFTQIKRDGSGVYQQELFCFVHLSIQEFLAAFYVFYTFNSKGENLLTEPVSAAAEIPAFDFYKAAVDKALDSKNGDWDLFLRFLLGLSLETNQNLLKELLSNPKNKKETNTATIEYIKEKIREENSDADKNFNLFYCLNELNDHSLVEEVKTYLQSETVTFENFSASQWSALTFVLLTSDQEFDVFDLKKYLKSEKVLLGMLPVVKVSKTALLSWCELSEESCKGLSSSVLSSASSNLTKLDLSHNDLLDTGVQKIADGLKSLHCKLEILKMSGCQVTRKGCSYLASALRSNKTLKHLDLSYNHPGDNGMMMLSAIAEDPNTSLQTVCFDHCGKHRLKPGLKKYCADMKLNENTTSNRLILSKGNREVRTVKKGETRVVRPENKDRFKRTQVLCEEAQKGLCYWEVEWKGSVGIGVTYEGVGRGWCSSGGIGCNENSWSLRCSKTEYFAIHGMTESKVKVPPCEKIALFLDWDGGILNYYSVTSGELSLIHSFKAKFTEPLLPAFWFKGGWVKLLEID